MAKPVHKDPNGNPSATELGEHRAWLRAHGFSAAQVALLKLSNTRRQNAALIAGWQRARANAK